MFLQSLFTNKKGAMALPIMLTLIGIPIVLSTGYFTLQFRNQQVKADHFILFKETINSVIEFTRYGLEKKKCFQENWSFESHNDCRGEFSHPRSSDRLLFGKNELASLKVVVDSVPECDAEQKTSIANGTCGGEGEVQCPECLSFDVPNDLEDIHDLDFSEDFTDFTAGGGFALSPYFKDYTSGEADKITITKLTITVKNEHQKYTGYEPLAEEAYQVEKYVSIKVDVEYEYKGASLTFTLTRDFGLYRREMSTFALVLAKDMYFYTSSAGGVTPNSKSSDQCIPPPSQSTVIAPVSENSFDSYEGLVFQSPVFVNGDIHFNPTASSNRAPVYFMDKVYLGDGTFKKGSNADFTPAKIGAGMDDSNLGIGGFFKGVALEENDKGLEVFAGLKECAVKNKDLLKCLAAEGSPGIDYNITKTEYPIKYLQSERTLERVIPINMPLAAGPSHNCVIKEDETVACWGKNNYGQTNVPSDLGTVKQISAGNIHTCAVKTDDSVVCWGFNGQYRSRPPGTTFRNGKSTPTPQKYSQISAGSSHTCAVRTNGSVACWGYNGNSRIATVPSDLGTVKQISARNRHTCAVKADGIVRCWGNSANNRTTVPSGLRAVQVSAGYEHTCAVRTDGRVQCWGNNDDDQAPPNGPPGLLGTVKQVSAGFYHTCAVKTDGRVQCWGNDHYNQAPPNGPPGLGTVKQISVGDSHTCAVKTDGSVVCWGYNGNGQAVPPSARLSVGNDHTCFVRTDGIVRCWGNDGNNRTTVPDDLGTVKQISAGKNHTCAVKEDETVACWGRNHYVQAPPNGPPGLGTVKQISAGEDYTCAVRTNGSVACWGDDHYNQAPPNGPPGLVTVKQVSAGPYHACAVKTDGSVQCWGSKGYNKTTVPSGLGTVKQISAGNDHTCAVKTDGRVQCWGNSANNRTTVPDDLYLKVKLPIVVQEIVESYEVPVETVSSSSNTCAIRADDEGAGRIQCWGNNYATISTPPGTTFSNGKSTLTLKKYSQVSVGGHACAIRADNGENDEGKMECWGNNSNGQAKPPGIDFHRRTENPGYTISSESNFGYSDPSNGRYDQVSVGLAHTCAIRSDHPDNGAHREKLECWGYRSQVRTQPPGSIYNSTNQSDLAPANKYIQVSAGLYHTCALRTDGKLDCWGNINEKSAPLLEKPFNVRGSRNGINYGDLTSKYAYSQVSSGDGYTCAIRADNDDAHEGKLECWGYNKYGKAKPPGSGDFVPKTTADDAGYVYGYSRLSSGRYAQVSTHKDHSCAIRSDHQDNGDHRGKLECWGYNHTNNRSNPSLSDGDFNYKEVGGVKQRYGYSNPTDASYSMVYAGDWFTCAIKAEGVDAELKCWGSHQAGRTNTPKPPPPIYHVASGGNQSCFTSRIKDFDDGFDGGGVETHCIGEKPSASIVTAQIFEPLDSNSGSIKKNDSLNLSFLTQIKVGDNHACGIEEASKVNPDKVQKLYCWGQNSDGQLGDGTSAKSSVPRLVVNGTGANAFVNTKPVDDFALGWNITLAIQEGRLYCWGQGGTNYCGSSVVGDQDRPKLVTQSGFANTGVQQVSAGRSHYCLLKGGRVYCSGKNGTGHHNSINSPQSSHDLWLVPNNGSVFTNEGIDKVFAEKDHTCVLKGGTAYCFGTNFSGQLGDGTNTRRVLPIKVVNNTASGFVNNNITDIAIGGFPREGEVLANNHTCFLQKEESAEGGSVYCTGSNTKGQLGDGTTTDQTKAVLVSSSGLFVNSGIVAIKAGRAHTCAVYPVGDEGDEEDKKNKLYCWGDNSQKQLDRENGGDEVGAIEGGFSSTALLIGDKQCTKDEPPVNPLDWFFDLSPYTRTSWDVTHHRVYKEGNPVNARFGSKVGVDTFTIKTDSTAEYSYEIVSSDTAKKVSHRERGKNEERDEKDYSGTEFWSQYLIKECVIKSSVKFVSGFFVCDKFTIESRSTALRIIGTVITSQLDIHPNALKAGVTWGSIWQPQALYELRDKKVLSKFDKGVTKCDNSKNSIGNPIHSGAREESFNCSPKSLRRKHEPFTWTSVDPDCAQLEGSESARCKFYIKNYISEEISRSEN